MQTNFSQQAYVAIIRQIRNLPPHKKVKTGQAPLVFPKKTVYKKILYNRSDLLLRWSLSEQTL